MKKRNRILAMLMAVMLLLPAVCGAETALEEPAIPAIPDFTGTLAVRPIRTAEEAVAYAKEIWALDYLGMDFTIDFYEADIFEDCWVVYAKDGPEDGDYCYGDIMFDPDGNVVRIENASSGVYEGLNESWAWGLDGESDWEEDPDDADWNGAPEGGQRTDGPNSDEWVEWREELDRRMLYPFLEKVCPRLYAEYTELYPKWEINNDTLTHYMGTFTDSYDPSLVFDLQYSESYHDETWSIEIIVQTSPVVRIVSFDIYADAETGGNG